MENKKNIFILKEICALLDILLQVQKHNCRNPKNSSINQCYPKAESKIKSRTYLGF